MSQTKNSTWTDEEIRNAMRGQLGVIEDEVKCLRALLDVPEGEQLDWAAIEEAFNTIETAAEVTTGYGQ